MMSTDERKSSVTSTQVELVRSMADVSETFLSIATWLRSLRGMCKVTSTFSLRAEEQVSEDEFRVGEGEGFRAEWYAEAEFADSRALSFSQEAAWHRGEWVIDASVRNYPRSDDEVILELPRRYAVTVDEAISELKSQSRLLVEMRDEAIRRF